MEMQIKTEWDITSHLLNGFHQKKKKRKERKEEINNKFWQ